MGGGKCCAVYGCKSSGKKDKGIVRFFIFPTPRESFSGEKNRQTKRRRQAWYHALYRADITAEQLDTRCICSRHFVSGRPSDVMDVGNVDWCPSLHLPKNKEPKKTSIARSERQQRRADAKTAQILPSPPVENNDGITNESSKETPTKRLPQPEKPKIIKRVTSSCSVNSPNCPNFRLQEQYKEENETLRKYIIILRTNHQAKLEEIEKLRKNIYVLQAAHKIKLGEIGKLKKNFNAFQSEYQSRLGEIYELREKLNDANMEVMKLKDSQSNVGINDMDPI